MPKAPLPMSMYSEEELKDEKNYLVTTSREAQELFPWLGYGATATINKWLKTGRLYGKKINLSEDKESKTSIRWYVFIPDAKRFVKDREIL